MHLVADFSAEFIVLVLRGSYSIYLFYPKADYCDSAGCFFELSIQVRFFSILLSLYYFYIFIEHSELGVILPMRPQLIVVMVGKQVGETSQLSRCYQDMDQYYKTKIQS